MDLRGHGESSVVEEWDWDAAVGDVAAVVAELGMRRPVVVGHSLGRHGRVGYGARHQDVAGVDERGRQRPDAAVDVAGVGRPTDALAKFEELKAKGAAEALEARTARRLRSPRSHSSSCGSGPQKSGISAAMLEAGARRGDAHRRRRPRPVEPDVASG